MSEETHQDRIDFICGPWVDDAVLNATSVHIEDLGDKVWIGVYRADGDRFCFEVGPSEDSPIGVCLTEGSVGSLNTAASTPASEDTREREARPLAAYCGCGEPCGHQVLAVAIQPREREALLEAVRVEARKNCDGNCHMHGEEAACMSCMSYPLLCALDAVDAYDAQALSTDTPEVCPRCHRTYRGTYGSNGFCPHEWHDTPEVCPRCGSDDPKVRKVVMPKNGSMYDWQDCPDPFHDGGFPMKAWEEALTRLEELLDRRDIMPCDGSEAITLRSTIESLEVELRKVRAERNEFSSALMEWATAITETELRVALDRLFEAAASQQLSAWTLVQRRLHQLTRELDAVRNAACAHCQRIDEAPEWCELVACAAHATQAREEGK